MKWAEKVVLHVWKHYYSGRVRLRKADLPDWKQEVHIIAFLLENTPVDALNGHDVDNFVARKWYHFLRTYGYVRRSGSKSYTSDVKLLGNLEL